MKGISALSFGLCLLLASCGLSGPAVATEVPSTAIPILASPPSVPPATATIAPTPEVAPSPVEYVSTILGDPNPFGEPISIAFDGQDHLYVVDSENDRIQIFDPNGKFMTMWDKKGNGDGQFNFHRTQYNDAVGSLAIDAAGNIYVVDTGNFRVQKFDSTGKFLLKWGGKGRGEGQFLDPLFIAVDQRGNVYVNDDELDNVQKFDSSGRFMAAWGGHVTGSSPFDPGGLTVDSQGIVYVTDYNNSQVQAFDSKGKFVLSWGRYGTSPGQFNNPAGIVADAQGNIYVSDAAGHQWIQKFTSNGTFLGKWGSSGKEEGEFIHPLGLGIDSQGNIYVVDTYNNRIQKFRPK